MGNEEEGKHLPFHKPLSFESKDITDSPQAQRKVKTPPPDADTVRLSAKSKVQAMRKAELIRMTREGMPPEEIYQSLTSRGMELKKGVATVLRLQSAWGVARDEKRWLGNFRHQCHKKAKAQQADAFTDIAKELGVKNIEDWVQEKMKEQGARQARHELALKLMGEHAPTNPERRKLQKPRRANGPSAWQAQANDADENLDSGSSEDEHESESPFPGPVTDLRFELVESAPQGGHIPSGDVLSPSPHQVRSGTQSASYTVATTNETSGVGGGDAADEYHEYPSLHGQPDDSMYEPGDGQHGVASTPSRVPSSMVDLMPQSTPGPHMPVHPSQSPNEMPASVPPRSNPLGSYMSPQPTESTSMPTASATTTAMLPGHGEKQPAQSNASVVPPSKSAASVASGLVLAPEEAEANKSTLSTLDQYNDAARVYKELLEARNNNKPLPGSLTGMPPSAKEVESAKRMLKEATQAMMLALD